MTATSLCENYRRGANTRELADRFGLGKTAVTQLLRGCSVPIRNQGPSAEQIGEATVLYREGNSVAQAAETLGLQTSSVYDALKRSGVQLRSSHEDRKDSGAPPTYLWPAHG